MWIGGLIIIFYCCFVAWVSSRHRQARERICAELVARLEQHVDPVELQDWAMQSIQFAGMPGHENLDDWKTNAPESLERIYGDWPILNVSSGHVPNVSVIWGRSGPGLVVGDTNFVYGYVEARKWRPGIYILPPEPN